MFVTSGGRAVTAVRQLGSRRFIQCRRTAGLPISLTLGLRWAIGVRFQIQDQFWIPQPKLHRAKYILDFFIKPQNGFFAFLLAFLSNVF